jgi:transcriptional regulator with XRE-family HTH domain
LSIALEQLAEMTIEGPKTYDAAGFYAALAATVTARELTWKQVSRETGISPTTLTRMAQGRQPDAASLASLAAWAGINPADFVSIGKRAAREPLAQISQLLRSDPRLKPDAARTLDVMLRSAYEQLRTSEAQGVAALSIEKKKP